MHIFYNKKILFALLFYAKLIEKFWRNIFSECVFLFVSQLDAAYQTPERLRARFMGEGVQTWTRAASRRAFDGGGDDRKRRNEAMRCRSQHKPTARLQPSSASPTPLAYESTQRRRRCSRCRCRRRYERCMTAERVDGALIWLIVVVAVWQRL